MATLNATSSFQSWNLTPEEQLQGSTLTLMQKQCIQNQICQFAEEKLSLTVDMQNIEKYIQQEAELQGKIGALRYLIILSEEVERATNQQASFVQSS